MARSIAIRGRRLSTAKKKFFPDLKSFIVSSVVIIVLIAFAVLVTDHNNVRRLYRYSAEAEAAKEACYEIIDQRVGYTKSLIRIIDGTLDTESLENLVAQWNLESDIASASRLYVDLDEALERLQRTAIESDHYPAYSPYFDQIFILELQLIDEADRYEERASFYNNQKRGFPALLVAKRHNLEDLLLFDFASSLKGRP